MGRGAAPPKMVAVQKHSAKRELPRRDQMETRGFSVYTTSYAYTTVSFKGLIKSRFRKLFWQAWAPGWLKFFVWLLHKNRFWCNDRLQRRGWPNGYFCQMCLRNLESAEHLFWNCNISYSVWLTAAQWHGCTSLHPDTWKNSKSTEIITSMIDGARPELRKALKSMIFLSYGRFGRRETKALSEEKLHPRLQLSGERWSYGGRQEHQN